MRLQINGSVLYRSTGRIITQIVVTLPIFRRPNRPRRKPATAIRADIAQNRLHAVDAKRAFKTANSRIERVRQQGSVAVFAGGAELEHGDYLRS